MALPRNPFLAENPLSLREDFDDSDISDVVDNHK
jgi:hypothetical protein